jgi:Uma2 family endonuclease
MSVTGHQMTAEELFWLPDDGLRHELVYGEPRTMPPKDSEHGPVTSNVQGSLSLHMRAHRLGRVYAAGTGFLLARNPDLVRAPDVAFVRRERVEAVGRIRGYWPGAPGLAVEVVSPSDRRGEIEEKVRTWLAYGTQLVIVVYPEERRARIHRSGAAVQELGDTDRFDDTEVVPGWIVSVGDWFE